MIMDPSILPPAKLSPDIKSLSAASHYASAIFKEFEKVAHQQIQAVLTDDVWLCGWVLFPDRSQKRDDQLSLSLQAGVNVSLDLVSY
jgi:hypothetical protein